MEGYTQIEGMKMQQYEAAKRLVSSGVLAKECATTAREAGLCTIQDSMGAALTNMASIVTDIEFKLFGAQPEPECGDLCCRDFTGVVQTGREHLNDAQIINNRLREILAAIGG